VKSFFVSHLPPCIQSSCMILMVRQEPPCLFLQPHCCSSWLRLTFFEDFSKKCPSYLVGSLRNNHVPFFFYFYVEGLLIETTWLALQTPLRLDLNDPTALCPCRPRAVLFQALIKRRDLEISRFSFVVEPCACLPCVSFAGSWPRRDIAGMMKKFFVRSRKEVGPASWLSPGGKTPNSSTCSERPPDVRIFQTLAPIIFFSGPTHQLTGSVAFLFALSVSSPTFFFTQDCRVVLLQGFQRRVE